MKTIFRLFVVLVFILTIPGLNTFGQVSIKSDNSDPDASAMLDVSSSTKGLLAPRMTMAQRDAITTPATGLLVYQTDNTPGYYYYNGTAWTALAGNSGSGFTHYVGELYGGGIVVGVWKVSDVEHGLIASLTDVSSSAQWSSITGTLIGPTAQSPIDGQANTTAIIAQGDVSGAAYLCDNYTSGGFIDWYLPATWEMNQCYNAAFVVNTILGATDGFQFDANYWSSMEYGGVNTYAWYYVFYIGYTSNANKIITMRVRAVRRF